MIQAFWATYAAVLVAEVLGDKFLYTTGVLATRYRTAPMMIGIAVAFMAKMGLAIAVGDAIATLPRPLVAAVTATGFAWIAARMWNDSEFRSAGRFADSNSGAAVVSCAAVLCSEWADPGQITAATMVTRFHVPMLVWMGAVTAMMTKAVLVVAIGAEIRVWLRRHVSERVLRCGGFSLLLLLGGLSVAESLIAQR